MNLNTNNFLDPLNIQNFYEKRNLKRKYGAIKKTWDFFYSVDMLKRYYDPSKP
jgi:hypothetical protein